jgi:hypothetical protein
VAGEDGADVPYDDRDDSGLQGGGPAPEALTVATALRRDVGARLVVVIALAACAWWVVGLQPFSGGATVAVVGAGAAVMIIGWWERRRRQTVDTTDDRDVAGVAVWAAWAVVAGAWQLAAYLQHPRDDHPTVSSLTNALLDSHVTRAVAFVLWIVAARGLARR